MTDKTMKEVWLAEPTDQFDDVIRKMIEEKWDDEPNAIQILEVVDHCVYYGAASSFVIQALNFMLASALKAEGTTFDKLIEHATWRNDHA